MSNDTRVIPATEQEHTVQYTGPDRRLLNSVTDAVRVDEEALKQNLPSPDVQQAKVAKMILEGQFVEQGEQWVKAGDDLAFDYTKILFRHDDTVFMIKTKERMTTNPSLPDLEGSEPVMIPPEDFCPEFKQGLTPVSVPLLEDIYIKKPSLMAWQPEDQGYIAALVLQEAEICETLKKHPHPNIAQYHGCLLENGRIAGLCFTKYGSTLEEALAVMNGITEREMTALLKAIEDGIRHLHRLGLAHNDINPSNIMMDGEKPVIIDFDSARPIGEKLGYKIGTVGWELEEAEFSGPENDLFGLAKIQELAKSRVV